MCVFVVELRKFWSFIKVQNLLDELEMQIRPEHPRIVAYCDPTILQHPVDYALVARGSKRLSTDLNDVFQDLNQPFLCVGFCTHDVWDRVGFLQLMLWLCHVFKFNIMIYWVTNEHCPYLYSDIFVNPNVDSRSRTSAKFEPVVQFWGTSWDAWDVRTRQINCKLAVFCQNNPQLYCRAGLMVVLENAVGADKLARANAFIENHVIGNWTPIRDNYMSLAEHYLYKVKNQVHPQASQVYVYCILLTWDPKKAPRIDDRSTANDTLHQFVTKILTNQIRNVRQNHASSVIMLICETKALYEVAQRNLTAQSGCKPDCWGPVHDMDFLEDIDANSRSSITALHGAAAMLCQGIAYVGGCGLANYVLNCNRNLDFTDLLMCTDECWVDEDAMSRRVAQFLKSPVNEYSDRRGTSWETELTKLAKNMAIVAFANISSEKIAVLRLIQNEEAMNLMHSCVNSAFMLCETTGVLSGVKLGGVISSNANYKKLQRNREMYNESAATAANKDSPRWLSAVMRDLYVPWMVNKNMQPLIIRSDGAYERPVSAASSLGSSPHKRLKVFQKVAAAASPHGLFPKAPPPNRSSV